MIVAAGSSREEAVAPQTIGRCELDHVHDWNVAPGAPHPRDITGVSNRSAFQCTSTCAWPPSAYETAVDALLYARAQMGLSLAFHIVFAAVGVALPVLMVIADVRYLRTRDPDYLTISRRLAKGTGILFAVGAVSGTVLSFELGLLWPRFMERFGPLIGLPFALEGFAFFTEAIFLGIYLYGRERVSPRLHLFSGVAVAVSGAASAFFVTLVNAFMNDPGDALPTDPLAALFSPSWPTRWCTCWSPATRPPPSPWPASTPPCCCASRPAPSTARRWASPCRWPA